MVKRFGIYCRVSTDDQEEGYSHESQERLCREYLTQQGITVAEEHVYHETFSGRYWDERPKMRALLLAIKRHDIQGVVALRLDRISRDQTHLGVFAYTMERAGGELCLVAERIDDSSEGRLMLNIRGYVAENQVATTRYLTILGREARAKKGFYPGVPKAPYGYRFVPDTTPPRSVLALQETEVAVLHRICTSLLAGESLRQICLHLTAEGVPTPGGRSSSWASASVRKMINNPVYVGRPAAYRVSQHRNKVGKWEVKERDASEHIALPEVPAVWSDADVTAMKNRLRINKKESKRNNRHAPDAMLRAGVGRCAYCGKSLILRSSWHVKVNGEKVVYSQYACNGRNRDRYGCPGHAMNVRNLDNEVWLRVLQQLRDEHFTDWLDWYNEQEQGNDGTTILRERLREVEEDMDRMLNGDLRVIKNATARKAVLQQIDLLGEQKDELAAMLARREKEQQQKEQARQQVDDIREWCAAMRTYGEQLPEGGRRIFLQALQACVVLWNTDHDERWAVRLRLHPDAPWMWVTASGGPLCQTEATRLESLLLAGGRTSSPFGVSFVETTSCCSSHNCMPEGAQITALECDERELVVYVASAA